MPINRWLDNSYCIAKKQEEAISACSECSSASHLNNHMNNHVINHVDLPE